MSNIAYIFEGKEVVANLAPGITPTQAAEIMGLTEWREVTEEEAAQLRQPTVEQIREQEQQEAVAISKTILTARMMTAMAQTETFTTAELTTLAKAGLFEDWAPGAEYAQGKRFVHGAVVYEAQQPVTAQGHQPPGSEGMLAVYRPISVDPETGAEPDGSLENPYTFISGMDVHTGKHYSYAGKIYLAKADMLPCVWNPDTQGLWQWEEVE